MVEDLCCGQVSQWYPELEVTAGGTQLKFLALQKGCGSTCDVMNLLYARVKTEWVKTAFGTCLAL